MLWREAFKSTSKRKDNFLQNANLDTSLPNKKSDTFLRRPIEEREEQDFTGKSKVGPDGAAKPNFLSSLLFDENNESIALELSQEYSLQNS